MILKEYFLKLKLSISSIDYYIEALKKPLRYSSYFFLFSMLFIGILNGINTSLVELPKIKNHTYVALDDSSQHFDENLEIIWADDQLELNQEYANVYWPSTIDYKKYDLPNLLAIISDSETSPSESELLRDNSSLIYLNRNNLYTLQEIEGNLWSEYPLVTILDGVGSYSINKQNFPKIISEIQNSLNQSFSEIQVVVAIISSIIFIFSKVWFLVIESILIYFLFKIYNFKFNFKKVLKLTSNIMVPTAIIGTISKILYPDLNFPMDSVAFWTILTFISLNLGKIQMRAKMKKKK